MGIADHTGRGAIVVLPTYNEAGNIEGALSGLLGVLPELEVLVVDDASPDGTGDLAEAVAVNHPDRVHVLHRGGKGGLGTAYCAGFDWALQRRYPLVAQMDADGSHPVDRLPAMIAAVASGTADVAVGSRYVTGGGTANWPLQRRILSRGANLYARTLLRLPQHDVTGAFRVWDSAALQRTDPTSLTATGYSFMVEMMVRAYRRDLRVAEVPITFVDRVRGCSKMDRAIALEGLTCVWRLRAPLVHHRAEPEPVTALAA